MNQSTIPTVYIAVLIVACALFAARGDNLHAAEPAPRVESGSEAGSQANGDSDRADFTTLSLRGRVVWLGEALERLHGVKTVPEAAERALVLEADDGTLTPLVEDVRGRAFRADKRLRGIEVELLGRQHRGSNMLQVIQVFAIKPDGKYELDYWCEVCAIAMFELKPCDCCQGATELRERKVEP